jgi:protein translocase SecG subunit
MQTVLIVIHLMIVLALVGIVLIQRSEGGGLGIGGGSGLMSARGAANALTRTTGILAAAFFVTSLGLGILARYGDNPTDILDRIPTQTVLAPGFLTSLAARLLRLKRLPATSRHSPDRMFLRGNKSQTQIDRRMANIATAGFFMWFS